MNLTQNHTAQALAKIQNPVICGENLETSGLNHNQQMALDSCGSNQKTEADKLGVATILPAITELTRWTIAFQPLFMPYEFALPVISIESEHRKRRRGSHWIKLGHYAPNSWRRDQGDDARHGEIVIVAEYLSRGVADIAETLLHELVHHVNATVLKVNDCSINQYHNGHFRALAEKVGLRVSRLGNRGWAETALGDGLIRHLELLNPCEEVFSIFRVGPSIVPPGPQQPTGPADFNDPMGRDDGTTVGGTNGGLIPAKNKIVPWMCKCKRRIYAARLAPLNAICKDCETKFQRATATAI